MGIDVRVGYDRGEKVTSYEAIKHLYLAIKAGISPSLGAYGQELVVHNFEEDPKAYYVSLYYHSSGLEKEFKQIKEDGYIAYYPDYIEIKQSEDSQYGSWWFIESLTGLIGRSVGWNKLIPDAFDRNKFNLPIRRWVMYHESLRNIKKPFVTDREEYDFPIYPKQKVRFDYNMKPIGELPIFPKYKINRKKMNLLRKEHKDFPQYIEAMFKLLPPLTQEWFDIAKKEAEDETLDKKYRMFLGLLLAEKQYNGWGYLNRDTGLYELSLSNILERFDWQLKKSHPEVLDKVQ
jgi:hypothetical protein